MKNKKIMHWVVRKTQCIIFVCVKRHSEGINNNPKEHQKDTPAGKIILTQKSVLLSANLKKAGHSCLAL